MTEILSSVIADLLILFLPVILVWVARQVRLRFTPAQIAAAEGVARIAVRAAEQIADKQGWDSRSKFFEALDISRELGCRYGVKLTDAQWAALIEASLVSMRAAGEELKQGTHASDSTCAGTFKRAQPPIA